MQYPSDEKCVKCGSFRLIKKGRGISKMKSYWVQRYQCGEKDCGYKQTGKERHHNFEEKFQYQSKSIRPQNWPAYDLAQNNHEIFLMQKIRELLSGIEIVEKPFHGRPSANSKDILFALAMKNFNRIAGRRLHSRLLIAKKLGFMEHVPKKSTLMKYLAKEELTTMLEELILQTSLAAVLVEHDFAVDSSGFSTSQFGRWQNYRNGKAFNVRDFLKAHIMIGVKTHIVTAIIVTSSSEGDSPQFQKLVEKTSENFEIIEVSADKAYSSRDNLEFVRKKGGIPLIPFKKNTSGNQIGSKVWYDSYRFFTDKPQEFGEKYHKRSNVESAFNMIKQKFGQNLVTKNFQSQKNEILLKIFLHNTSCLIHEHYEGTIKDPLWTEASKTDILSPQA